MYRGFDVSAAQFLIATFWLAVTIVALSAAVRRARGRGSMESFWPLYPAVSADYATRSTVAWVVVAVFGIVLAPPRPLPGAAVAGFGLTLAGFTVPVVFPVAVGAAVRPIRPSTAPVTRVSTKK